MHFMEGAAKVAVAKNSHRTQTKICALEFKTIDAPCIQLKKFRRLAR